ncbi:hypothetical protein GQ473_07260 [archaeon]|nr:hypothetical protein [archaeon]
MAEVDKIERYCVGSGDGKIEPVSRACDDPCGVSTIRVGGNRYSLEPDGTASGFKGYDIDRPGRG